MEIRMAQEEGGGGGGNQAKQVGICAHVGWVVVVVVSEDDREAMYAQAVEESVYTVVAKWWGEHRNDGCRNQSNMQVDFF